MELDIKEEEKVIEIIKDSDNILTCLDICFFYCKEIFPKQISEEKIKIILESLISKGEVEKFRGGKCYYILKESEETLK